jgi:hypothetical protein
MVNIEKITSTLAKLPDQALQRYAMMHKDDPYIVALAVSESNRRKELRAAGQAQPMQQQPKVVDQAVAEMAPQQMPAMPEEQGIGALPAAQQMEFADGGITGYAGGGEIESYQDRGLVRPYETPYDRMTRQTREAEAAAQAERLARIQAAGGNTTPYGEQMANVGRFIDQYVPDPREIFKTVIQAPGYEWFGKESAPVSPSEAPKGQAQLTPQQIESAVVTPKIGGTAGSGAATGERALSGAATGERTLSGSVPGAGAPRATAPSLQSIEDRFLATQKRMTEQANPFQTQEDALTAEQKKFAEEKLAAITERNEKFKDAFKGREGRIEERAKELEKSKDTNTGLAFLEAGLAIMSTPGSLGTAIGKGAREGTAKYAAGIEKLRSAKEKLDEARDRIEELKLNRDEMSAKEIMEAKLGIQQAVLSGKKDALSSAKTLYGDRSALAQTIVKETLNVEENAKNRANQLQAAGVSASIGVAQQQKFIDDWLKKPENAGKTYSDAYAAFKSVGAASERNDISGLKAVRDGLAKDLENLRITPDARKAKEDEIARIDRQILTLSGIGGGSGASTKTGAQRTIDWNSIK